MGDSGSEDDVWTNDVAEDRGEPCESCEAAIESFRRWSSVGSLGIGLSGWEVSHWGMQWCMAACDVEWDLEWDLAWELEWECRCMVKGNGMMESLAITLASAAEKPLISFDLIYAQCRADRCTSPRRVPTMYCMQLIVGNTYKVLAYKRSIGSNWRKFGSEFVL